MNKFIIIEGNLNTTASEIKEANKKHLVRLYDLNTIIKLH